MKTFRQFAKRSVLSLGFAIALITVNTPTTAHGEVLSLREHLAAVSAAPANQYVGKPAYKVVNAAEFTRMKDYITSQYEGVQSVHVFAYDEDLVVDCVDQYTQLGATRHGLNASNWKTAPKYPPRLPDGSTPSESTTRDPGVFLMRTDTDAYGNLRGCAPGSVPVNRITLDMVAIYPTLADYHRRLALPSTNNHEYAKGTFAGTNNAGGEAYINAWNPFVEVDAEASIMQLWVVNGSGNSLET